MANHRLSGAGEALPNLRGCELLLAVLQSALIKPLAGRGECLEGARVSVPHWDLLSGHQPLPPGSPRRSPGCSQSSAYHESGPTTRTKGVRPRTEACYARFSRTALEPTLWAVKKGQTCVHGTSCLHFGSVRGATCQLPRIVCGHAAHFR